MEEATIDYTPEEMKIGKEDLQKAKRKGGFFGDPVFIPGEYV